MPRQSRTTSIWSDGERAHLEAAARRYTSPYRDLIRARIVLYAAQGLRNDEIAVRLDAPRQIVSKWRKRFYEHRLAGLGDLPPERTVTGFSRLCERSVGGLTVPA